MIFEKILTKSFLITIARYAIGAIGTIISTKGYLDENTVQVIGGALLTIITALLGGTESVKDKVTQDGKTLDTSKLTAATRNEIKDAVATKKTRTWFETLLGK